MKIFKKLNRGAIISIIAILGVVIYLLVHNTAQKADKPEIKKVAENYINTYVKYNMLPEDFKKDVSKIPKKEIDDYILKMENDIKSFFAADDNTLKYVTDNLKTGLENQKVQNNVVYSYEKEISSIKYKFDESAVTVTVISKSKYDGPDKMNPSAGRSKLNAVTNDVLVLKKISGSWKIIYSNIDSPSKANSLGGGFKNVQKIEILPYHKLGVYKWEALGLEYPLNHVEPPSEEKVDFAFKLITAHWNKPLTVK